MPTHARVRAFLESAAKRRILFTYQEVAKALDILPPHSIHQVTEALERLMEEDAVADRPFIAALAISKTRGGLPAPGFVDYAERLGRFANGQDARTFHAAELNAIFAHWGGSPNTSDEYTLFTDTNPTITRGGGLCRPPPLTTARVDVRRRLSEVQERPRRPGNLHRGEGVRVHRRVPTARPPAHLHQYARGGHDLLSLLRHAVPLRFSIDTPRC